MSKEFRQLSKTSASSLQCKILYGLKTNIIGNAQYVTDGDILYPVGNALSIHNISQRRQKLILLPDKQQINIIAVSPNRKYVAVSDVDEKPTISIYDLQSLKRKKTLGIPYDAPGVKNFSCLSFTADSKNIAAITGEPDQMMLFYNWEKGKVESNIKVGNPQSSESIVTLLSCNPGDVGIVALGGPYTFKFLTVSETVWRPYGFAKAENLFITTIAWLNIERLLAGTKDARLLFLENGELKFIFNMLETIVMNLKIREEFVLQTSSTSLDLVRKESNIDIVCLTVIGNCFVYGFGNGKLIVFEQDGQNRYVKKMIYHVPRQISKIESQDLYRITSINSNISSDRVIVTTGWSQLFSAKIGGKSSLPSLTTTNEIETLDLETIGENLHHGPIIGLSMCTWKSIFITCGQYDRSVRIWDYESENLIMIKQYMEDIFTVSLHPNGLFCLIGFSDKLRFMTILIDDLMIIREFPIKNCKIASFSHGGHLFAAVNGNIVHVYSTMDFRSRFLLKGHTGIITGFSWSKMDAKLITIGNDGAVYEWEMFNGTRITEVIIKEVTINGVVLSSDDSTIYCISNDKKIHEIKDSLVIRSFNCNNWEMSRIILGKDNPMMLVSCPGGTVVSIKYPLQEPTEFQDFRIHSSDITELAFAYNERTLITTGVDGTLCFWKVTHPDIQIKDDFIAKQVLIDRTDLKTKIQQIQDLSIRVTELETEHIYKLKQNEIQHNDIIRDIHQGYGEAIQQLQTNIEQLEEDHENELSTINNEISKLKSNHEKTIQNLETNYETKLITEYEKYNKFEKQHFQMRQENDKQREEFDRIKNENMKKLSLKYEEELKKKSDLLDELKEEMSHREKINEQMRLQIEDDADQEIVHLRVENEKSLENERQLILKLRGEIGLMRNKYLTSQKNEEELIQKIDNWNEERSFLKKTIENLEKELDTSQNKIHDKESTIHENETKITNLKSDNRDLEKYKFLLDQKITELKTQIDPKDKELQEHREKIHHMETELINLHKTNINIELEYRHLKQKFITVKRASNSESEKNKKCQMLLKRMHIDIFDVARLVQEPKTLKTAIKKLYHKYCNDDAFLNIRREEFDVQCEFNKQREHLERTIASLRKQVFQDTSNEHKQEKLMDDNILLLTEINPLRESLKKAEKHISDMEYILGLKGKNVSPDEAKRKLAKACKNNEKLQIKYTTELQECQQEISVLKDDIKRLVHKIEPSN